MRDECGQCECEWSTGPWISEFCGKNYVGDDLECGEDSRSANLRDFLEHVRGFRFSPLSLLF